jgi:hypothetical protein
MDIKYAHWEDLPVRLVSTPAEGWVFGKGQWQEMNAADAISKAKLMSKEDFETTFPDLPPLPAEAFKAA